MASLKVNPGTKITAVYQNKVVDAICSLQDTDKLYGRPTAIDPFALQDNRVPVFNLCWYQQNENQIVLYANTQNKADNIVYYNSKAVPYKPFGYTTPDSSGAEGEIAAPKEIKDGIGDAIYKAVCTVDVNCITNGSIINLQIIEKIKSPCEDSSSDGSSSSSGGSSSSGDLSGNISDGLSGNIGDGLSGNISGGLSGNISDGLSGFNNNGTSSDTSSNTNTSSETSATLVYTFANSDEIKKEWSKYNVIQTFPIGIYENYGFRQIHDGLLVHTNPSAVCLNINPDSSVSSAHLSSIQFDKYTDPCTSATTDYLTFFNSNQAFTSAGILERKDVPTSAVDDSLRTVFLFNEGNVNKILKYAIPSQYYILNDISGQESAAFVAPSSISTYKDLWIGCAKETSAISSTIYFENPYKIDFISADLSSTEGNAGNVTSADYIFTISANNECTTDTSAKGVWKAFRPYQLCLTIDDGKEDYLSSQLCTKHGQLEYIILGPNLVLCEKPTDKNNGFEYCNTTNEWTLNLSSISGSSSSNLSAGCYIQINNDYINGPSMKLIWTSPECAQVYYSSCCHQWIFELPKGSSTSSDLSAGCYIEISNGYINGPQMNARWSTDKTVTNPYFQYLDDGNSWLLTIPKLSGTGGETYNAGCYIQIDNENNINGPELVYTELCEAAGDPPVYLGYIPKQHKWLFGTWPIGREVSAGCYIKVGTCDCKCLINGPEITANTISLQCSETPSVNYSETDHRWNIDIPSHVSAGKYMEYGTGLLHGPGISLNYISRCENICETGFSYTDSQDKDSGGRWQLNLFKPLSAGIYLCQTDSTIKGPKLVVDESTSYDHPTFEYDYSTHEWYFKTPPISGGGGGSTVISAVGDGLCLVNGVLQGPQIGLALGDGLTGAANYDSGNNLWTIELGLCYRTIFYKLQRSICDGTWSGEGPVPNY